jgi:hypothetical protein
LDYIFINNPELRPYFYDGLDISEGEELYNKVSSTAEFLIDYFDAYLIQATTFPQTWANRPWDNYMLYVFRNSPIICRFLLMHRDWYDGSLEKVLERALVSQQPIESNGQL